MKEISGVSGSSRGLGVERTEFSRGLQVLVELTVLVGYENILSGDS